MKDILLSAALAAAYSLAGYGLAVLFDCEFNRAMTSVLTGVLSSHVAITSQRR